MKHIVYFISVSAIVLGSMVLIFYEPLSYEKRIRNILLSSTYEELLESVGPLGIVFEFRDQSWLAIAYDDSHAFPPWSRAIALDSEGEVYKSTRHWCGRFMIYKGASERGLIELELFEDNEIHSLSLSSNLVEARKTLTKMGFRKQ